MKKLIILAFLLVSGFAVRAQGILNNGAYIVMSGAAQIYVAGGTNGDYKSQGSGVITPSATSIVSIEGDWVNNASNSGFSADAGTVQLVGAAQSITGSTSTLFYNLTLLGTNTKTLFLETGVGGGITTNGVLSLGSRQLNLNSHDLEVYNPNTGAITYTTGSIISETNASLNPSFVRWYIGSGIGIRTIPFGTTGGVLIPLTLNITSGMPSGNYLEVSTRPTLASNNLPWAVPVTHMFDPNLGQDGSDEAVIDRWWELWCSASFTASITFSYTGAENTMIPPYNTGNIGAQWWWNSGWLPNNSNVGSAPAVTAGVGSVTAPGIVVPGFNNIPMVLSSLAAPLPIELISFESQCNDSNVSLSWTTSTETNNNFFTIERSDDGVAFRAVGTVQGAGNSTQNLSYSFVDTEPTTGTTYYRLKQTDYNGQSTTTSPIVQEQCGNAGETISAFGDGSDLVVSIYTPQESNYVVNVFDAQGKLVTSQKIAAGIGSNRTVLSGIIPSVGVYMINVTGDSGIQYGSKVYFAK